MAVEPGGTPTVTPSAGGNAGGAVKLAFIGPLSGAHSDLGFAVRDGARVAVQQAKDSGVKVDLVEGDTQVDPAQASAIKGRFINDPGVVGVVGPSLSDETRTLLPDLEANNLAMVSASASDVALPTVVPNEAVFHRVVPDDTAAAAGIASYIVKEVKPHSVVYVNDSSDYGRGLADATMKAVAATGIPGQPLTIDPNTQDLAPVLANIKAANPDLVFYGGYVSNAGALVKRLRDIGVTAKFISGEGALDPGFVTTAGAPAAEGAIFACSCRFPAADAGGALGRFATQYAQINKVHPSTRTPPRGTTRQTS
ncbi:ABC transporter substrate-binding protein [Microlunatus sp. Gsoil 973]|nr:ABC transporter substrate-binding protein [Microlunatus sp. Gsoil 973]